jgi:hypothetical protein
MKNTNLTLLFLSIAALSLTACGGGSSSESNSPDNNQSVPTPAPTEIEGGTVNGSAQMDHRLTHIISSDDAQNYFKVSVQAGQRIVIFSALETYLDDQSFARCGSNPTGYHVGISLVGTDASACANNFEHTFDFSGEAEFRFGYPYENSGVFVYSIVGDADDSGILEANGEGGLPDSPRRIDVFGENTINSNNLVNYFVYEGVAGETITLNAYLNGSIAGQDPTRCSSSTGSESLENHYTYGFAVNNRQYNCDNELSYTFTENGVANIHVKYIKNISGYFVFSSDR